MGYDLAGLRAPVTLLWNRGGLHFERVELAETGTRAVVAVDIEGGCAWTARYASGWSGR